MQPNDITGLFWALVGLSTGAAVTAYSITGAKARNLWILSSVVLAAAFLFRFGIPAQIGAYAGLALEIMWVLYPPATIAAVALVLKDFEQRQSAGAEGGAKATIRSIPSFAVAPFSKWKPDITFEEGVGYLGSRTRWTEPYSNIGNTVTGTTAAIIEALGANKITAWAREHPGEGELYQMAPAFWFEAEVTLDTGYAFSRTRNVGAFNVHLCSKEMEQVWPPKKGQA